MTDERRNALKDFGGNAAGTIVGLSGVSDDWISQVKTYYKVDLNEMSGILMLLSISMCIELLISRVEDLISKGELGYMESVVFEWVAIMVDMAAEKRDAEIVKERSGFIEKTITNFMKDSAKLQQERGVTTPNAYSMLFFNPTYLGINLPQDVLSKYMLAKI